MTWLKRMMNRINGRDKALRSYREVFGCEMSEDKVDMLDRFKAAGWSYSGALRRVLEIWMRELHQLPIDEHNCD